MAMTRTTSRAEALVTSVEATIAELSDPSMEVPLTVIQRLERALELGHRSNLLRISAVSESAMGKLLPRLTKHQMDTLRLYQQLGTIAAVADFRGVSVEAVDNTLLLIRVKLGIRTTAEAIEMLPLLERAP